MMKTVSLEEEYKKQPEVTKEQIQEIIDWVNAQPHIQCVIKEYEALIVYHANFYDMELTKKTIDYYLTYRTHYVEISRGLDVTSKPIQQVMDVGTCVCLPEPTPEGNRVIFLRWHDNRPEKFVLKDSLKFFALFVSTLVWEIGSNPGYIFVADATGVKFSHSFRLEFRLVKLFFKFIQDALLVRVKRIHIFNMPFRVPMELIKPFIKTEYYEMIKFSTLDEIYKEVPARLFPSDYPNGKAPSVDKLREQWYTIMKERREQFLEEERIHVVDESKRTKENKKWLNL